MGGRAAARLQVRRHRRLRDHRPVGRGNAGGARPLPRVATRRSAAGCATTSASAFAPSPASRRSSSWSRRARCPAPARASCRGPRRATSTFRARSSPSTSRPRRARREARRPTSADLAQLGSRASCADGRHPQRRTGGISRRAVASSGIPNDSSIALLIRTLWGALIALHFSRSSLRCFYRASERCTSKSALLFRVLLRDAGRCAPLSQRMAAGRSLEALIGFVLSAGRRPSWSGRCDDHRLTALAPPFAA